MSTSAAANQKELNAETKLDLGMLLGNVTNVDWTTQQKRWLKTLDSHWQKQTGGVYRLYLSSTSSTLIVDDEQILVLKKRGGDLKIDNSGVELTKEMLPPDNTEAKAGTLENLLMWARNQKYDSSTFHCVVRIDKVRTKKGWNYPSCGGEKCKECNLERKDGRFWCDSCNSSVDYPVIRYRLELDISDAIAEAVVVMFDETAKSLVKCSASSIVGSEDQEEGDSGLPPALANIVGTSHTLELKSHTYFEHGNCESFTCWKVVEEEDVVETGSSGTVAATADPKAPVLKSLVATPSITTPSKPEESSVANSKAKGEDVGYSSDTRKRKRMEFDDTE
ncbi:ATP-dependent DNA helicase PIF1-like protein [Tanacetum coccineum]